MTHCVITKIPWHINHIKIRLSRQRGTFLFGTNHHQFMCFPGKMRHTPTKTMAHSSQTKSNLLPIFAPVSSNVTTLLFLFQTRSCTACGELCSVHQVALPAYKDSLRGCRCSRDGVKLLPLPVFSCRTSDNNNKKMDYFRISMQETTCLIFIFHVHFYSTTHTTTVGPTFVVRHIPASLSNGLKYPFICIICDVPNALI